jgi:predicted permease
LTRWSARAGELAIRTALGAGRARVARQLLTEAGLLAAGGGLLGTMLAVGFLRGFIHYAGSEIPRLNEMKADGRVFVIGLSVTLFTALLFGGLPALRSGGVHIQNTLRQSGRFGITSGYRFVRQALVGGELALSLILLTGAVLFSQTLWHLRHDRLGFQPEHVLSVSIPIKGTRLEGENRTALVGELLEFTYRIPDVVHSAQSECTPLTAGPIASTFSRADRLSSDAFHPGQNIHLCGTGPEYAAAAGLHVLAGRFFSENDYHHRNTLAVINETAARIFFPGEHPVGKRIMVGREHDWKTVIGIVSDSKNVGLNAVPSPQGYVNGPVYPEGNQLQLVIRILGDPRAVESAISEKLHSLDPGLMADCQSLDKIVGEMSGGARFNAILVGSFAVAAFLMAVVGVYGVVGFAVSQRTQEIGIRIALGGERWRIFALVFRNSIVPVCVGIVAGLAMVAGLSPYFNVVLYSVSPLDPVTLIGVAIGLALAASVAIALPARRASAVDPVIALRHH